VAAGLLIWARRADLAAIVRKVSAFEKGQPASGGLLRAAHCVATIDWIADLRLTTAARRHVGGGGRRAGHQVRFDGKAMVADVDRTWVVRSNRRGDSQRMLTIRPEHPVFFYPTAEIRVKYQLGLRRSRLASQ
jgi:hypothetical protein